MKKCLNLLLLVSIVGWSAEIIGRRRRPVVNSPAAQKRTAIKQSPMVKSAPVTTNSAPAVKKPAPAPAPTAPVKLEPVPANNVITLQSESEFDVITKKYPIVVAAFSTSWCGPCQKLKPVLAEAKKEMKNVVFLDIDGDKFGALGSKHKIPGFPTIHLYKNGKKVDQTVGAQTKDELKRFIGS